MLSRISSSGRMRSPLQARLSLQLPRRSSGTATMRQHKDLDVLVVGGGMVGAALACSLERIPGMRVGIVDARTPHARMSLPEVPDVRVCAVTPTSERLLAELGAWDAIKAMRVAPYRHMQVWDEFGCVRYSTDDVGEPHLGHIIENNVISQALDARMEEVAGIQVIRSSQVAKLTLAENGLRVTAELDNGDHISSRLVIGADGRQSKVRTAAGLDSWQWKYGQKAVICTVNCVEPTSTAWQCFLPSGPLALLPMPEKYCNIVWSLPSEHADRVLALSDDEFVAELNNAFSRRPRPSPLSQWLPRARSPSWRAPPRIVSANTRRQAFPLVASHAQRYFSRRIVVIGDAAHTVHPLAGQGLNLGLSDVASLTKVLRAASFHGADIGSDTTLEQYQQDRMLPNLAMVLGCHMLESLFDKSALPMAIARGTGLDLINDLPSMKRMIIKMASTSASNPST